MSGIKWPPIALRSRQIMSLTRYNIFIPATIGEDVRIIQLQEQNPVAGENVTGIESDVNLDHWEIMDFFFGFDIAVISALRECLSWWL